MNSSSKNLLNYIISKMLKMNSQAKIVGKCQ